MTSLRFITIEFMDGTRRKFSFPEQAKDVAAKQIKLDDFFKSRSLVISVEGRLNIFPIDNMPRPIQLVTYVIPLRYYAEIIRGVFLRGSGLGVLWPEAVVLLGMGLAIMALASLRFRKRLD